MLIVKMLNKISFAISCSQIQILNKRNIKINLIKGDITDFSINNQLNSAKQTI